MLLVTALALVLLFVFTGFIARFYHQDERSLARQWSAKADTAMRSGDSKAAIEDYRTALIYSRENGETSGANEIYELHLAEALATSNHLDEARTYFLTLAEREPGNAAVNLELARLAAQSGELSEASRYYNAAIFGVWGGDPAEQRRAARIEYSKFLLEHNQPAEAQAQLIALAAALPSASRNDAELHIQAGQLLMESGANFQALEEFQHALQLDRGSVSAARGAGLAAYLNADYHAAVAYFERASHSAELTAGEKQALETSRAIVSIDPFTPSLSTADSARRASSDFALAQDRAHACATSPAGSQSSPLQQALSPADDAAAHASVAYLRANPDNIEPLMQNAFQLENAVAQACGPLTGNDLALQLLGRSRAGSAQ